MIIRYIVPEMRRETNVIVIFILGYTFPFYPSSSPKNENFKTMKTKPGYIIFYTTVPKIMIRCYTIPEILRVSDVIVIVHFGQFLALLPL